MGEITLPYLFGALMALEYGFNAWRGNRYQDPRDCVVSIMVAVPHFALLSILPVVWVFGYRELQALVPWQMPDAWWTLPLGVVMMDFAAYWMHRYHHALNITWGIHSVHHSSDEYTITTGARSSFAEPVVNVLSGAYLFLVVPALIGLPIVAAGVGWLVKDCWGFAVHTRNIRRLGVLEAILATPSHHRVHHAIDPVYIGKNYGFVFIIWDKLFGTFQPELESVPPTFGTTRPPLSFHPVAVALHELRCIWRDAVATRRWRDRLRIWFMPAGWRPADVPALAVAAHQRYQPPAPPGLYLVGSLQLAYFVVMITHMIVTVSAHGIGANLAYLGFLVAGTIVCGEYFEQTRRYVAAECVRGGVTVAMVAATGTWFGRPVDELAALLMALGGANVIAAAVFQLSATQRVAEVSRRSTVDAGPDE